MNKQLEFLTPKQVSELLMVSPITVRQWAQKDLLKAELTAGGHRRFFRHEVERFARERGLTFNLQRPDKLKILVVDDDEHLLNYLVELFKRFPEIGAVEVAQSGFEAGIKISSFEPHLVLLDLIMPKLDGFEVCQQLKKSPMTRAIRVIAMTGNYSEKNVEKIMSCGAEACLSKPFKSKELLKLIGINKDGG